jgi:hypothetical protein
VHIFPSDKKEKVTDIFKFFQREQELACVVSDISPGKKNCIQTKQAGMRNKIDVT